VAVLLPISVASSLQELVVALQWMVLLFENSFLSVALQEEGKTLQMAVLAGWVLIIRAS
jgi:hypothetical protein